MNKPPFKYAQAMKELSALVEQIQSQELDVDELSEAVKKSLQLIKICRKKLQSTELEIKKIIDEFEKDIQSEKQGDKDHEKDA